MKIILASSSPRRSELLQMIGLSPTIIIPEIEERRQPEESILSFVQRISASKGLAVYRREHFSSLLISADTVVVCGKQMIGKPVDRADAESMLRLLSGRNHEVLTGVSLVYRGQSRYGLARTRVSFKKITDAELSFYLSHADYMDKAGAYAIQDLAALFIKGIEGCFFNVMGFPLNLFYTLAQELGVSLFS